MKVEPYLTRKEVAAMLRITLATVDKYCKRGMIPAYRIGRRILFKKEEIEAMLKNNPFTKK